MSIIKSIIRMINKINRIIKIPWPILFEESAGGWQHPMATYYGISGIPTVVLIGRDGKVITLDARGEKLGEQLDVIFKDAG